MRVQGSRRHGGWPVVFGVLIIFLAAGAYVFFTRERTIVSPVPSQPSYEVIFYTPTPLVLTPTAPATPSATTEQKNETKDVTETPAQKNSPTATPKKSSTTTETPTPTTTESASPTPEP